MKLRWIAMTFLGLCANVSAYDPVTHEAASENAAKASVLADRSYLARIGLKPESISSDIHNVFYSSEAIQLSIVELIKFGANWEDSRRTSQGKYHFFNPLTGGGKSMPPGFDDGPPSPNWALEDKEQFADQPFSYRKGRQYFLDALTKSNKSDRNNNWGMTFQTLGHVIHHLQDMAQPQHTRDDAHCDIWPCALTGAFGFSKTNIEEWTKINAPATFFEGYAPVYTKTDNSIFTSPRKFWATSISIVGAGMAEYSNRGFFSAGTNVGSGFPFPTIDPNAGNKIDIQEACNAVITPTPCPPGLRGNITFFATNVNDSYRPDQSGVNTRATTHSVFDADLKRRSILPKFTVNRFTFDATNSFTLKRAVGYSAGMINYFFRGEMDLKEDLANLGKFAVKNGSNETMGGTLSLHYDLEDGQRNRVAGFDVNVNPQAEAAVTIPVSDFKEMPYRVDNEAYMMVFKGTLGEEKPMGASPGAVMGTQIRIRNVFDIYDTLYQPESE